MYWQLDQKVSKFARTKSYLYELEGIVVGEVASGQDLDDQNEGAEVVLTKRPHAAETI